MARVGMQLSTLCRETSALWQLMLSGNETQEFLLVVDEFSGANVLERDGDHWSFWGDFSSAAVWNNAVDALVVRPPHNAAYAAGALVRRGSIELNHCPAFH